MNDESGDGSALRYDEGKNEFHLLPIDGLTELAKVYNAGAKKYAPRNWEKGMAWSRCYNSLLRHLFAFWNGEDKDPETGLHHLAHVVWNAMALLVYGVRGIGRDDRMITDRKFIYVWGDSVTETSFMKPIVTKKKLKAKVKLKSASINKIKV